MPPEEKSAIEARALGIPTTLLEDCHRGILKIREFLPYCNTNIVSDAKVGIHTLAGAARSAYQVSSCIVGNVTHMNKMYVPSHSHATKNPMAQSPIRQHQTIMVNSPSDEEKVRLKQLLKEIRHLEDEILS